MNETRKIRTYEKIIIYVILAVFLILTLFPLVYVIASSFKTNVEIMANPERIFPEK